jgi:cardiolipin synthase
MPENISIGATLLTLLGIYAVITGIFLIAENRRPQATLAWLLVFDLAPGIGLLVYLLFGRHWKAFSRQTKLLMHDLEANARPLLTPLIEQQDAEIIRLEQQSASHRKLMMLIRRNSHSVLTRRNQATIMQNADRFYPCLIEDMQAARQSIHLQYFIWRSDPFCEQLKEILAAKAQSGVEVRLLYDALGSNTMSRAYRRQLRAAGVQVAPASPVYHLHTISYRNHRKITVIDGKIAYTGGMNIGQEHLDGGKGFTSWRDTQLRLVGQAAAVLQGVFMVDWYNAVGENLFEQHYFPPESTEPASGDVPVQILPSGPDSQWSAIQQLYSLMIVSAVRHVYLQSPYFVLDASIAEALRTAALSGIDVKVMLSSRASGNQVPEWAGNTFIADIVRSGVRIFLYEKGYLHAKTISIDSSICSIGSANIDVRSFSINYELNAVVYDAQLAQELEQDFLRDLEHCREFDVAEYRQRNRLLRFRDSVARLFSPLL